MTVTILPREKTSALFNVLTLLGSLLAGLVAVGIVFLLKGINPFFAIGEIFIASFGSAFGFQETLTKAIPLILIGAGLALAYRAKFWNIGAESQLLLGAVFATWVGLKLGPGLPAWAILPLMFLAGFIGGGLWGLIPAIFKVRFGINEVISTLMLNYIAAEFVKYLVVGPWKGETKYGYPYTDDLPDQAILQHLGSTRISVLMLIIAVSAALILAFLVYRTRFGYEIRVIGENPEAGRYAGINFFRTSLIMMFISGGVAGLAGVGELSSIHHHLSYPDTISAGYGFTAIIVAWLGRLNPGFSILSGLFFAGIIVGGDAIQMSMGLPATTVNVFNGLILIFLIAGDFLLNHKVRFQRRVL
ncbi:ABC transporter permease [Spirochaeta isovalerica]|uniref:Simple sugar transport system permease protein n=1 Tax=Spirochaeta isovalerica TaxID=150 RepID=A0A841R8P1_9SPIO|nr:ABC transporter permease [Spirochaeta isovalerica]MBB6479547.1 simple sugar transport system permease protein [Spirochaeta isovalerica]